MIHVMHIIKYTQKQKFYKYEKRSNKHRFKCLLYFFIFISSSLEDKRRQSLYQQSKWFCFFKNLLLLSVTFNNVWEMSTKICYQKDCVGQAACRSKAHKEARLVERKVCFISDAGNWGRGMSVQRPTAPSWQAGSESSYRQRGQGGMCRNTQSSLAVIFKSVTSGLTSISSFQVQLIFSSRVHLSPFLYDAISSRNRGSSSPGYRLLVM